MKNVGKNIAKRFWWVLPLLAFDFFYYFFIQYLVERRAETGDPVVVNVEGIVFLFLISLISIGCVRLSDKFLSQFKRLSLPGKYLISIFLSFFIFIIVVLGGQYLLDNSGPKSIGYLINISMLFLFLHLIVGNAAIAVSYFRDSMQLSERLLRMESISPFIRYTFEES